MQQDSIRPGKLSRVRAVPAARRKAREEKIDLVKVTGTGPNGMILVRDIEKFQPVLSSPRLAPQAEKVLVSPLARRLADSFRLPLDGISGTGSHGKIILADVIQAAGTAQRRVSLPGKGQAEFGRTFPMSRVKKVTARRMAESAFTAPHIYFFADVHLDPLFHLREELLPEFEKENRLRISFNDFFIKATALTIREFPLLNAKVQGEGIVVLPEINIGVAVAMEEGLMVPALPRADQMNLGEIARMRNDLIKRARSGQLKMEEIERGTFTISSLAQFDILFFTAILNPPQSGILSIGKTTEQLFLKEGQAASRKTVRFGLGVDHRIIDGAMAAAFLQTLKKKLEHPLLTFVQL
ncbi:MAG: branched-chain alpha-keto acid dehydrogenase subunit [Deltaproteobacteria bacterium]|nr:branched-chain alpha-keto acid dehydrogenase subunit [Deltaproteobacteria bacterium]